MGVPLDLDEPFTTDAGVAGARGVGYDDPAAIPFWWERGALDRLADRARHPGDDRAARPVRDVAVPAVPAARRHRRRRSGGGPPARPPAALHDQHRRAQRGRHGDVAQPRRHAVERPGLPARLLRQPVPRLAGDARRGRGRVHDAARQRAPAGRPLGRRRPVLVGHGRHAPVGPAGRGGDPPLRPEVRRSRPGAARGVLATCRSRTPTSRPSGSTRSARSADGRSAARATATWRCGRGGRRRGGPTTRR